MGDGVCVAQRLKNAINNPQKKIGPIRCLTESPFTGRVIDWSGKDGIDTVHECVDGSYLRVYVKLVQGYRGDMYIEAYKNEIAYMRACRFNGKEYV